MTGKVKVWQTSYIQKYRDKVEKISNESVVRVWQTSYIRKYRDNYCEENHEMSSDRNVQSEMAVEEKRPRNLAWPLKNKYGMSCACGIQ